MNKKRYYMHTHIAHNATRNSQTIQLNLQIEIVETYPEARIQKSLVDF